MAQISISYASAETVPAIRIAEDVRQTRHSIFLGSDRKDGIAPDAAWQRTLLQELRNCDAVVFLSSRAGQASKWCHSELVIATEQGKRVYSPDLGPDLPPRPLLQEVQGIRFDSTIDASIRRPGRPAFTEVNYVQVGGMDGAISRRTEAAEARLPSGSEPVLGHLLPRSVALSEDRAPAARPAPHEH